MQLAAAFHLLPQDYVAPYYRDDSILLGIGMKPYEVMLQLHAKKDDPFSAGRTYYSHPSLRRDDMPKIPHQSSATGMQTIPTTGVAQGVKYLESEGLADDKQEPPVVVCSLGDGALTEGEVSEALQMAVLHQYPIIYLVQDNEWDISASADEIRAMDAPEFAKGFKGLEVVKVQGNDFFDCYERFGEVCRTVRKERRPFMVYGKVPLLGHHTSGVRREMYRPDNDLEAHHKEDPIPVFRKKLEKDGFKKKELDTIKEEAEQQVEKEYEEAYNAEDPDPEQDLETYHYAPSPVTEEKGERQPDDREDEVVMVDAALHAVEEIMKEHPESLLYGQDVGRNLGGVFREAATLAEKYGDERVFNTPIQEAYIIGSSVGMSAAGCRPIVEIQFADYIWPGLNQLFTEASRSHYLSCGKWPVHSVIRVPTEAYGGGGPYHSGSVESVLMQIKGIKVVYPSNAADMKGLFKAAFYDPNPVVTLEHKGLYWSILPGTEGARTIEPDEDYVIPLGKGRIAQEADDEKAEKGETITIITYAVGVWWAINAAKDFQGQVEVIDLRTLQPLDEELIFQSVQKHNKCLVLTEEPKDCSFAQSIAGRITENCFQHLDGPVRTYGSKNLPAIPLNEGLEKAMLPSAEKVKKEIEYLLNY
jgi:2-oxoisovalerate dehydrogenase E1 component